MTNFRHRAALGIGIALSATAMVHMSGCRSTPSARDWPGHGRAMALLAEERRSIESFSGACTIRLRDAAGTGATLDGAMAVQGGEMLRLRAWKFGRAVFDLTSTAEGVWIMPGDDPEFAALLRGTAEGFGDAWSLLSGAFFDDPGLVEQPSTSAGDHTVERTRDDGTVLRSVIDRRTLTPTSFALLSADRTLLARLDLDRYRETDGIRWPMRMAFTSERGNIDITFREIEFGADLPPAAFRPPARAVRQP